MADEFNVFDARPYEQCQKYPPPPPPAAPPAPEGDEPEGWRERLAVFASEPTVTAATAAVYGGVNPMDRVAADIHAALAAAASPGGGGGRWPTGAELIAAERRRQVEVEGWTPDHDLHHGVRGLYAAAECYHRAAGPDTPRPREWPWDAAWWKPKWRLRNLVRAGALYQAARDITPPDNDLNITQRRDEVAAEIDALLAEVRAAAPAGPDGGLDREAREVIKRAIAAGDRLAETLDGTGLDDVPASIEWNQAAAALAPLLTGGAG